MGSDVTIGMRTKKGKVICANSYSHVFNRIMMETDLVTPSEHSFRKLLMSYIDDKCYGPTSLKLQAGGLFFVDFKEKVIFDAQTITNFSELSLDMVRQLLLNNPKQFRRYVPHFSHVIDWPEKQSPRTFPVTYSVKELKRAKNRKELWEAMDTTTSMMTLSNYHNGEFITVARAFGPDREFVSLRIALPNIRVLSYNPSEKSEVSRLESDLKSISGLVDSVSSE
jgi:hypothetical protein